MKRFKNRRRRNCGVGAIGLGVGGYFGIRAISLRKDANRNADGLCRSPEQGQKLDDARSSATFSTVLMAAGGVMLAGGIGLFALARRFSGRAEVQASLGPAAGTLNAHF